MEEMRRDTMEHISVKNICKKYGEGESAVKALDEVCLDIAKREICVILGPSGSGKSTLLISVLRRFT